MQDWEEDDSTCSILWRVTCCSYFLSPAAVAADRLITHERMDEERRDFDTAAVVNLTTRVTTWSQ